MAMIMGHDVDSFQDFVFRNQFTDDSLLHAGQEGTIQCIHKYNNTLTLLLAHIDQDAPKI